MKSGTIVFIHGMYMNSLCWEHWESYFQKNGFKTLAPDWPGRDQSIESLRKNYLNSQLGELTLSKIIEHYTNILEKLDEKPIIIGHSMGGLVVQLLHQKDLAAAGVAIDSAAPMGVFSTKWSFLKANWAHITPFVSQSRPIVMTFERFQYAFVNGLPMEEQRSAYDRYVVPESRRVPRESLTAKVDFKKQKPPLLLVAGSADNIIPASLNKSNYNKYKSSSSVTSFNEFPGRTHYIIGQKGWEEVAGYVNDWLNKNQK